MSINFSDNTHIGGNLNVDASVTASYFVGDGSKLSNIVASASLPAVGAYSVVANISGSTATPTTQYQIYLGTPGYADVSGTVGEQVTSNINNYYQVILHNKNSGSSSSSDIILSNNAGTNSSSYLDLGINSTTFTGSGSINIPGAGYLYNQNGDLALGTIGGNTVHLFVSGSDTLLLNTGSIQSLVPFTGSFVGNLIGTSSYYSLPNNQVLFVTPSGSDTTGLRNRIDYPFQTLTGAHSASISGDTIVVFPGTYSDYNLGKNGVNWFAYPGAKIYYNSPVSSNINWVTSGYRTIFTDNNQQMNYTIKGNFELTNIDNAASPTASTSTYILYQGNTNSTISMECVSINCANSASSVFNQASLFTYGNVKLTLNGNWSGSNQNSLIYQNGGSGSLTINGNLYASSSDALYKSRNSVSYLKSTINGNVSFFTVSNLSDGYNSGNGVLSRVDQIINGDVYLESSSHLYSSNTGDCTLNGSAYVGNNCSLLGAASSGSMQSTIQVNGNIYANNAFCIYQGNGNPSNTPTSNVIINGSISGSCGYGFLLWGNNNIIINGNYTNTNNSNFDVRGPGTSSIFMNGICRTSGSNSWANVASAGITGDSMTFVNGGSFYSQFNNMGAMNSTGSVLVLKGCSLISTGGGNSVFLSNGKVISYGCVANTNPQSGVNVLVDGIKVDSNVI